MQHRFLALALLFVGALALQTVSPSTADAQSKPQRLASIKGAMLFPTLSHDGKHLAYSVRDRGKTSHGLFELRIGGKRAERIATGVGAQYSPDGTKILYYSDGLEDSRLYIAVMDAEERQEHTMNVLGMDPAAAAPRFSHDGSQVLYVNNEGSFLMPPEGKVTRRLSSRVFHQPAWSPDLKSIIYVRKGGGLSLMQLESNRQKELTPNFHGFNPVWSPDGSRVLYAHEHKLYSLDPAKRKRKKVIEANRGVWVNHGLGVAALYETGETTKTKQGPYHNSDAYWVKPDGSGDPIKLMSKVHDVVVAPDSQTVYFIRHNDGVYRVKLKPQPGEKEAQAKLERLTSTAKVPASIKATVDGPIQEDGKETIGKK